MYKCRRSQPLLPTIAAEVGDAVAKSRYAMLEESVLFMDAQPFIAGDDGFVVVFANGEQLRLLVTATQSYFDGTFKVVP